MKHLFIFLIIPFLFISCDSKEEKEIGKWGDIIKFDTKEARFGKSGGKKVITSKGDWWWILDNLTIDKKTTYLFENEDIVVEGAKMKDWGSSNVKYKKEQDFEIRKISGPWYIITKSSDKTLSVEIQPNDTGVARSLVINIEAGNYFDYISVYQEAN